jgi:hypothetical protein
MPPKSNSQASVPPPPSTSTKRQPRKLDRAPTASTSRAGSEGGVRLPATQTSSPGTPDINSKTGQAPRRRRPKKLSGNAEGAGAPAASKKDPGIGNEVEELKNRVISIEAQVQELLHRPVPANKPPRRRLRHQKGQESEPIDEMEKLQRDLETARGELASLRTRAAAAEAQEEEDEVEEILRIQGPGLERPSLPDRTVTLSGSYRIPLPTSVRNDDLLAIQKGISSAQNVARSFLDARTREDRGAGFQSQDGKPQPCKNKIWFSSIYRSWSKKLHHRTEPDWLQLGSMVWRIQHVDCSRRGQPPPHVQNRDYTQGSTRHSA